MKTYRDGRDSGAAGRCGTWWDMVGQEGQRGSLTGRGLAVAGRVAHRMSLYMICCAAGNQLGVGSGRPKKIFDTQAQMCAIVLFERRHPARASSGELNEKHL